MTPRRIDRSRYATLRTCPRKRYWNYEYLGKGLSGINPSIEIAAGIAGHSAMAALLGSPVPLLVLDTALQVGKASLWEQFPNAASDEAVHETLTQEWTIVEALLRAWHKARLPRFSAEYEVVVVEKEMPPLAIGHGIELMTRPDLVVRRRTDSTYWDWDWKFTGFIGKWQERWDADLTRLTKAAAIEAALNIRIEGVTVEGLYKGPKRDGYYTSPLVVAYLHESGEHSFEAKRSRGWTKYQLCRPEAPITVKHWIDQWPAEMLLEHFVQTIPLPRDPFKSKSALVQIANAEAQVAIAALKGHSDDVLDTEWPQNHDACWKYNRPCPFLHLCQSPGIDPMETGRYKWREAHHDTEYEEGEAA